MSFDCMRFACSSFFFCVDTESDIKRNWTKPPYVGLRLDQKARELVCVKNGGINVILLKKIFVVYRKRGFD